MKIRPAFCFKPMAKPLLVLMTRWPAANRCKSRLSEIIGPTRAAAIQQKLTLHTISVAKKLQAKNLIQFKVAIDGIGPKLAYKWSKSMGVQSISIQRHGSLGLKMRKEFLKSQANERSSNSKIKRAAIIIGTDLPSLCELDIMQAIKYLLKNELVIGPSEDGGYWLIGLNGKLINPVTTSFFEGINWGSNSVLKSTISIANSKGINFKLLKYKNDLDHLKDLQPWYGL